MKVCIIQPAYSTDYSESDIYFEEQLKLIDHCDESMDLIVLPEACDIPCLAKTKEMGEASSEKFTKRLLDKVKETAKRCGAILFVNARSYDESPSGRNTTYAFNRDGELVGKYFKQHLTPGEVTKSRLDSDYTFEHSEPTVIEIEGLRFAFLTCYDFYFYEAFANIARQNVDIVIGCSHQRSDTHLALEIMSQNLAYNTNSYVIRSSVSMDESSDIGGASMVVAPNGQVLVNMKSRVGLETVEIDPRAKYFKPAGFGNPPSAHYEYIEKGRRPWKYRPGGSAIVRSDEFMPYPRTCAHRGFNSVAPENSLAAFGAAVAMGAEEIEFDLWFTKDGEIVSIHDPTLERVSNGTGKIWEHTLSELKALDFGVKFGDKYKGLRIATFEELLKQFAGRAIMNIHVKIWDVKQADPKYNEIASLIRKYDCEKHVYFMSSNTESLLKMRELLPAASYCQGAGEGNDKMIAKAIEHGFDKVQIVSWYPYDKSMIDECHAHGIKVNFCQADKPNDANWLLDMGVDCILTNDFHIVYETVRDRLETTRYF